jgi:hypothetical protein
MSLSGTQVHQCTTGRLHADVRWLNSSSLARKCVCTLLRTRHAARISASQFRVFHASMNIRSVKPYARPGIEPTVLG